MQLFSILIFHSSKGILHMKITVICDRMHNGMCVCIEHLAVSDSIVRSLFLTLLIHLMLNSSISRKKTVQHANMNIDAIQKNGAKENGNQLNANKINSYVKNVIFWLQRSFIFYFLPILIASNGNDDESKWFILFLTSQMQSDLYRKTSVVKGLNKLQEGFTNACSERFPTLGLTSRFATVNRFQRKNKFIDGRIEEITQFVCLIETNYSTNIFDEIGLGLFILNWWCVELKPNLLKSISTNSIFRIRIGISNWKLLDMGAFFSPNTKSTKEHTFFLHTFQGLSHVVS